MPLSQEPDEQEVAGYFDRAVAHWNAGRFWHAHEDWEDLWNDAQGARKVWLQGLIQYAAAFFHFQRGFHASGFKRLLAQATEKVRGYPGPFQHLDAARLEAELAPWIAYGRAVAAGAAFPEAPAPLPVLHFEPGYVPQPLPWEPDEGDPA